MSIYKHLYIYEHLHRYEHGLVVFLFFYSLFLVEKCSVFIVSLYKGLSKFLPAPLTWKTVIVLLIVSDNLQEVFGCSLKSDSMSIIFGFSKAFGCWVIIFDRFTNFLFSFFKNDLYYSLVLPASSTFLLI